MARPRELLQQLFERRDLSQAQAEELLAHLTDPQCRPRWRARCSRRSRPRAWWPMKCGASAGDAALARPLDLPARLRAVDIVGTGGDASGSLNISTARRS